MKIPLLVSVILVVCISSCTMTTKDKYLDIIGKRIDIPTDLVFSIYGEDTIAHPQWGEYIIVSYIDKKECLSCNLQLSSWKNFFAEIKERNIVAPDLIVVINPSTREDAIQVLKENNFDWPVCIDIDNDYFKMNNLFDDRSFYTLLLDGENKVILVGNPVHSDKIKELYFQSLTCKED